MNISEIKAIDVHIHINHGVKGDSIQTHPYHLSDGYSLTYLEKAGNIANVETFFCSTYASVLSTSVDVAAENEFMRETAAANSAWYQWVVINPLQPETLAQARRMLREDKCVGIKLHPHCHKYSLPDYADEIFPIAEELGAFVEIHPDLPSSGYIAIADKYPHARLIIAHQCGKAHADAILGAKYGNIYTDTSGGASRFNHGIEYLVDRGCAERIFYGSDCYSSAFQRGRIEYSLISDEDKYAILRGNALREFGKFLMKTE